MGAVNDLQYFPSRFFLCRTVVTVGYWLRLPSDPLHVLPTNTGKKHRKWIENIYTELPFFLASIGVIRQVDTASVCHAHVDGHVDRGDNFMVDVPELPRFSLMVNFPRKNDKNEDTPLPFFFPLSLSSNEDTPLELFIESSSFQLSPWLVDGCVNFADENPISIFITSMVFVCKVMLNQPSSKEEYRCNCSAVWFATTESKVLAA